MRNLARFVVSTLVAATASIALADEQSVRAAVDRIDNASTKAAALIAQKNFVAVRDVYETALRELAKDLPPESDAGVVVSRALAKTNTAGDERGAANSLGLALAEAKVALTFAPTLEAELPQGFPAPGPVGQVVVKDYPAYRMARAPMGNKSPNENGAFMILFRHIQQNKIEMTAPVEMNYSRDGDALERSSMAFLYPKPDMGQPMKGDSMEVVDMPAVKVLSIGIRGNDTKEKLDAAMKQLQAELEARKGELEPAGEFRYMGYNSPFISPWKRFGEMQLPVRAKK